MWRPPAAAPPPLAGSCLSQWKRFVGRDGAGPEPSEAAGDSRPRIAAGVRAAPAAGRFRTAPGSGGGGGVTPGV